MKYFYLIIGLFISRFANAQLVLTGKVKSDKNISIESAYATLSGDSSFKRSVLSNQDGAFKFTNLKEGKYKLTISCVGYLPIDTTLNLTDNLKLSSVLISKPVQLDSVTIKSKKSFMEKKVDRVVYNVDGISLYDNKSVTDILKNISRLNVTRTSIELRGSGQVAVMIDDRIIYLSNKDLLDYLNVFKNDISSIEIITNPPAKYDAQGSALINIVTKRKKTYGFFGDIESGVTKNSYLESDETLNLSFRNKNFSLLTSVGNSFGAYQENISSSSTFFSSNNTNWSDIAKNKNKFNYNRFNIVAEWLLSKRTKIYSSYSLLTSQSNTIQKHTLNYSYNNSLDSVGFTNGNNEVHGQTNLMNLGLNSAFGKKKNTIDASIDYANKTSTQSTNTETFDYLNDLVTPTGTKYNLYSFGDIPKNVTSTKVDFVFPQLFTQFNVETGAKYTLFNNNSQTDYDELINNESVFNGIITQDTFGYREQNLAAYISLSKGYKKWSTKFGVRYEETMTNGSSGSSTANNYKKTLNDFFPSIFLQYKFTDQTSADFSYTRRIMRPTLFDVNPFKFYTSIFSYYAGNPALNPSLQDNYNLNFDLKSNYLFSAFYNITYNPIISLPTTNGNVIETEKQNSGQLKSYGINFDANLSLRSWMQNNFSISVSSYRYITNYKYYLGRVPLNISLSTSQSFQFTNTFSFDMNFSATLPGGGFNIYTQKGYSSLDFGFTKTMAKNRLILTVAAQDIFRSGTQSSTIQTNEFKSINSNYYDFREMSVSIKYKFGKEIKVVRKKSNIQEINRIR